ncbi:hypothetical protein [uncultured Campylobacter sp.]|uniref:hypothetical protein n=1 Tax=uncultured Campylobacter sp. TaxID=218934 RepID=UPI0026147126|nr:hypothetical protein [uncultured Campylobacter sp.]
MRADTVYWALDATTSAHAGTSSYGAADVTMSVRADASSCRTLGAVVLSHQNTNYAAA